MVREVRMKIKNTEIISTYFLKIGYVRLVGDSERYKMLTFDLKSSLEVKY